MTKRKPSDPPQTEALLDATLTPTGERRKIGRTERRVYAAVRTARERGVIDDLEDPLAVMALELARSMDYSTGTKPDPYAVATCSRELIKVLNALQFTKAPASADKTDDALTAALEALSRPEPVEP